MKEPPAEVSLPFRVQTSSLLNEKVKISNLLDDIFPDSFLEPPEGAWLNSMSQGLRVWPWEKSCQYNKTLQYGQCGQKEKTKLLKPLCPFE